MITKELWIDNVVSFIEQIASAEFQQKGWVLGEVHNYCCFVETICGLFDDSNLDDFIDEFAEKFGFSKEQIGKLNFFRKVLQSFIEKHGCYQDPSIIIKDPEWIEIRKMANDVLREVFNIERFLDPSKDIFKSALLTRISWITNSEILKNPCRKEKKGGENQFTDLMRQFFEVSRADQILSHPKEYEITESQYPKLKELYDALKLYREKRGGEEDLQKILDDPEWKGIQSLAQEVLKVFEFKEY